MTWGEAGREIGHRTQRMDMGVPAGSFGLLVRRLHDASKPPANTDRTAHPARAPRRA